MAKAKRSDQVAQHRALLQRARVALMKTDGVGDYGSAHSDVESHKGLQYVALRQPDGDLLAVYRVRNDGMLKRMRRWPASLK